MTQLDSIEVAGEPTEAQVEASARIWTAATAQRDDLEEPAPWPDAVPGIRNRLALPGATLFVSCHNREANGFALAAAHGQVAELFHLAVAPPAWGRGVAAKLLRSIEPWATALGCTSLKLWVIAENERALGVYERAGWVATQQLGTTPSGRTERMMIRDLTLA